MLHIYHPNKNVSGFACSFWFSDRDDTLFATLIKQSGWDEKTENGSFKASLEDPTKKVSIKLGYVEAAAILDCIERNRPFKTFHDNEQSPKNIAFTPWMQTGESATQRGFSFSVSIPNKENANEKNSFYIGLTFAEARLIREFLVYIIHRHFQTMLDNQARYLNRQSKQTETTKAETVNKTEESASKPLVNF